MKSTLNNELMELSKRVKNYNKIQVDTNIVSAIELAGDFSLPLRFKARVFEPGTYRGFSFTKEDIIRNMNTIFKVTGNLANNELNIDHKNNRKEDSSVNDLIGRVAAVEYDEGENALFMDCEVTDRQVAEKIFHGSFKFVSLRINPISYDDTVNGRIVRDFDFEELSIVRVPGYDNARIIDIQS